MRYPCEQCGARKRSVGGDGGVCTRCQRDFYKGEAEREKGVRLHFEGKAIVFQEERDTARQQVAFATEGTAEAETKLAGALTREKRYKEELDEARKVVNRIADQRDSYRDEIIAIEAKLERVSEALRPATVTPPFDPGSPLKMQIGCQECVEKFHSLEEFERHHNHAHPGTIALHNWNRETDECPDCDRIYAESVGVLPSGPASLDEMIEEQKETPNPGARAAISECKARFQGVPCLLEEGHPGGHKASNRCVHHFTSGPGGMTARCEKESEHGGWHGYTAKQSHAK